VEIKTTNLFGIDADKPIYSIGQVSELLDVKQAFLRRLDTEKVLEPIRSEGGQRRYSHNQIAMIQKIVSLTSEGFTLAGVNRLLTLEQEVKDLKAEIRHLKGSGRQK
jgi:DNA-binding transcriptional MerR regulator